MITKWMIGQNERQCKKYFVILLIKANFCSHRHLQGWLKFSANLGVNYLGVSKVFSFFLDFYFKAHLSKDSIICIS